MNYIVTRKEVATGRIFTNTVTQEQLNNITKYPISLYSLESINPIAEITEIKQIEESEPIQEPKAEVKTSKSKKETVNTVKELNALIKYAKREIKKSVDTNYPKNLIYTDYEYFKKEMSKYKDCNKTANQIYFNFLTWWGKIDKQLFPEYH